MAGLSSALGDLLPAALGVAISPLPIIATVLMLLSERARRTAPAFAVGWVVGVTAVILIVLAIAGPDGIDTGSSSDTTYWIQLVVGVLFLGLGANSWRTRPRDGHAAPPPKWMATIDKVSPLVAFALGALLSGLNPKNLALTVTGAVAIASNDLSTTETTVCVVVFVFIASLSIAGPVIAYLVAADAMRKPLDAVKRFMQVHSAVIVTVLLAVLGLSSVGKGIGGLLG